MYKTLAAIAGATIIVGCATAYADGGAQGPATQAPVVHASALEAPPHPNAPLACAVHGTNIAGGIRLEAVVSASRATYGSYELVVTKSGPSGSSDIQQGGDFTVEPGRTTVLGGSELSLERGSTLTARLVLKTTSGETGCVAKF